MAQKTGLSNFNTVMWLTVTMWFIGFILTAFSGASIFILIIPMLFSFVYAIVLRMHVVKTQNITECGTLGEFCCGFWCWYCSISQSKERIVDLQVFPFSFDFCSSVFLFISGETFVWILQGARW